MFSFSSRHVLLRDNHILVAQCLTPDGAALDSSLDLNNCLGNQDGRLVVGSRSFSSNARNVRLDGVRLNAMLKRVDGGYAHDSVNLDAFIGNNIGVLTL
jgi:hypothetical protein